MSVKNVLSLIKKENIKFIDLRFTDTRGKDMHVSMSTRGVDEDWFRQGKLFDGSSIIGWKDINKSDMLLMPLAETAMMDPFLSEKTLIVRCDVYDPENMQPYERDPRSLARRAEKYLNSTGLADTANFGPEPEFFLFDDVRWDVSMKGAFYSIDSEEASWNSASSVAGGNMGHRPPVKGGYFPVPPVDSSQNIRSAMCLRLEQMGVIVEAHHHEVATCNQNEIAMRYNSMLLKADEIQTTKYVIRNVAHAFGKSATFMPKPLVGDNGSGMHCHISLAKDGTNLFAGDDYAGLSEMGLHFIGGIIKHARALNAFTNPGTNSYKRLVPGYEAPIILAYSARNRSAAIRIPSVDAPAAKRIEIRFPDGTANPYLSFSAMLMAGLDGIQNKIHPGPALEKDLFTLPPAELEKVPRICSTLEEALMHLDQDREFLLKGDVFTDDLIDSYIRLKRREIKRLLSATHPVEFDMYYSD